MFATPPAEADRLPPPFGACVPLRPLGEGAHGQVWLARETVLDRLVAVKVLTGAAGEALEADAHSRREGRLLSRLAHPHVVTVHQFGAQPPRRWLVMEYVAGGDLAARLAHEPWPAPPETLRLVQRVGAALAHAHAHGVVHRDLKPQNVLLAEVDGDRWWPKVADFGLAGVRGALAATSIGPGEVGLVGTPLYMAPEQAQGRPADARADVYALALLAWTLLARRHPFDGLGALEVMLRQAQQPIPRLGTAWAEAPPALEAALAAALAKDPTRRTGSVEGLLAALRAATPAGGSVSATAEFASPAPRGGPLEARAQATLAGGLAGATGHQEGAVLAASIALAGAEGQALFQGEQAEVYEHLVRGVERVARAAGGRVVAALDAEVVAWLPEVEAGAAVDAGLAVRQLVAGLASDPTLEGRVRAEARLGLDRGFMLAASWLEGAAVLRGAALAGARAARAAEGVGLSPAVARAVAERYRVTRSHDQAVALGRAPALAPEGEVAALPFVGRTAERAALAAALDDAEATGAVHQLRLVGPSGVGKTRLLAAWREGLPAPEACLWSRCAAAGAPYAPVAEALAPWLAAFEAAAVEPDDRAAARRAARLLTPSAEALAAGAATEPARPGDAAAGFAAVTAVVAFALARGVRAWVLDDAQRASAATGALFAHLASQLADWPWVWIEARPPAEAPEAEAPAVPLDRLRTVRLGGLDAAAVAALVQARGAAAAPEAVGALHAATGGHPVWLAELLEAGWPEAGAAGTAPALDAVVLRRVDALGPEESELLLRHAVCGEVAWPALLGASEGRSGLALGAQVRRLKAAGLLEDTRDDRLPGLAATRFRHGLVRAVVLRHLPPRWRRAAQARLAQRLEAEGAPAALVAHHAAAAGDAPRAAWAALRAGEAAARVLAPAEALGWFEAAVLQATRWAEGGAAPSEAATWSLAPPSAGSGAAPGAGSAEALTPAHPKAPDSADSADSAGAAGAAAVLRAALLAGALACATGPTPEAAAEWLDRAETHPLAQQGSGAAAHRARVATRRAEVAELLGRFDEALAAAATAVTAAEALPTAEGAQVRQSAEARQAMVLARRGRLAEAEPLARAALARPVPEPEGAAARAEWQRARGALWAALGHVTCRTGRLDEGAAAYAESRVHWIATGWPVAAATAELNLGLAAWWAEDLETARARWSAAAEAFAAAGASHGLATTHTNLGELCLRLGELPEALANLGRAETALRRLGTRDVLPETLRLKAEAHRRAGALAPARACAEEAVALAEGSPGYLGAALATLAGVLADAGAPEAAVAHARALEVARRHGQAGLVAALEGRSG